MSHLIVCSSPTEIESFEQSFFYQLEYPEPCCLTLEDYRSINQEDFQYRHRYCSKPPTTDQPSRWASVLFEAGDVIEFRLRPPRTTETEMLPKKFLQRKTAKENRLYPWTFGDEVNVVVNRLAELNDGIQTWWGRYVAGKWTDIECLPGIPLNIYAGVNPRIATGGSTDADVLLARNLFVDLDKTSLADAIQKLAESKLPTPSMTVKSGHGVHFYWRIAEPIHDLANWKNIQKGLIRVFNSDPGIHAFSQPMRVPGFLNLNGETPVPCKLHDADPSRRYDLSDILPFLPETELQGAKIEATDDQEPSSATIVRRYSLNQSDSNGLNENLIRAKGYAAKFEPINEYRNSSAFGRACDLAEKFDLALGEVLPLVETPNDKSSDPMDDAELSNAVENGVRHVHRKGKKRGTALKKEYCRTEQYIEPTKDIIELETWRKELAESRLSSLGNPGKVYFDGSTTGAGKSTADLAAITAAKASAIILPTHDACEEEAAKLVKLGLVAAAHPPLNSETCKKFGTKNSPGPAQLAQNSGLNVGQCICTSCEFAKSCKYQERRELARNADHVIATHARASLSNFEPARDKPIIFIHEDVTNLFRPMVKVVRHAAKNDTTQLRHLLDILQIAKSAEDIAMIWQDEKAILFAKRMKADTTALIDLLDSSELVKEMEDAVRAGKDFSELPTMKIIALTSKLERFERLDYLLYRAIQKIGVQANGAALNLALAYSLGELEKLCVVVDEYKKKGGKTEFIKSLVGVWAMSPPESCVVWIENASTTAEEVKKLVGCEVIDKTPVGRLANKVEPLQFPDADITQGSSGNRVRGVIRGMLARYPNAQKVGIISHKCHQAEIEKLAPLWAKRITRKEYYRSGKDRASNSWLDCDLILIIGTPRVPKYAVRDLLIQTGKTDAACRNAKFGNISWEGKDKNGNLVKIDGLGYDDPDWASANDNFVKETLRQAVGRGRSVNDNGVQVVVASNESLGLLIADSPLLLLNDSEDETLQLAVSATARNVKYNTLAFDAANFIITDTVAKLSQYETRTVRSHLLSLFSLGLLKKKGERSGWILANWLLN